MELKSEGPAAVRRLLKLYDAELDEIRRNYGLSRIEITIVGFLHNNPGRDIAAEIAEIRMLPKGHVSKGIDRLIQNGLIQRSRDEKDRRKIHLSLSEAAAPVVREIEEADRRFEEILYRGISEEELCMYRSVYRRIMENAEDGLCGRLRPQSRIKGTALPEKTGLCRHSNAAYEKTID